MTANWPCSCRDAGAELDDDERVLYDSNNFVEYKRIEAKLTLQDGGVLDEDEQVYRDAYIKQKSTAGSSRGKSKRIRTDAQKQSAKRRAAELKKERSLESSVHEDKKQKLAYIELCPETTQAAASMSVEKQACSG